MLSRHYSSALRCVGQTLDAQQIEVFDLRCEDDCLRLECGDPKPPYSNIVELRYSIDDLMTLEIEAKARRGKSFNTVSFDGLPEIFRALGRYVDTEKGLLQRICNADSSGDKDTIRLEYLTRNREVRSKSFSTDSLYEHSVRMYKERARKERHPWG